METETSNLPDGEYAIIEVMGHRTYVGRVAEVQRFGSSLMQVEPAFEGRLLPPILIGGSSIYQFTPCTREIAEARQPKQRWQLPASVSALLPPEALFVLDGQNGEELPPFCFFDEDENDGR